MELENSVSKRRLLDSEDTESSGHAGKRSPKKKIGALARRIARSQRKTYKKFKQEHPIFWIRFNVVVALVSFIYGDITWNVGNNAELDCSCLRMANFALAAMHCLNIAVCMVNLTGCEQKLCTRTFAGLLAMFEVTALFSA